MAEKLKKVSKKVSKKVTKKQVRSEIYSKLSDVLAEYKKGSDSKKFERKLKQASKLFAPFAFKQGDTVKNAN